MSNKCEHGISENKICSFCMEDAEIEHNECEQLKAQIKSLQSELASAEDVVSNTYLDDWWRMSVIAARKSKNERVILAIPVDDYEALGEALSTHKANALGHEALNEQLKKQIKSLQSELASAKGVVDWLQDNLDAAIRNMESQITKDNQTGAEYYRGLSCGYGEALTELQEALPNHRVS